MKSLFLGACVALVSLAVPAVAQEARFRAHLDSPLLMAAPGPAPQGCVAPWGDPVGHGAGVEAFLEDSPAFGTTCQSEARSCQDGVLSGSFGFASCTVETAQTLSGVFEGGVLLQTASAFGLSASMTVLPSQLETGVFPVGSYGQVSPVPMNRVTVETAIGTVLYAGLPDRSRYAYEIRSTNAQMTASACKAMMNALAGKVKSGTAWMITASNAPLGAGVNNAVAVPPGWTEWSAGSVNSMCDWLQAQNRPYSRIFIHSF
jgi:hypothetical protein